jgi:lipoate-protein ligase A
VQAEGAADGVPLQRAGAPLVAALHVVERGFPGRAALDTAASRALLEAVANRQRPETLRLYRPDDVVAFSTTDAHRAGFATAVRAAREIDFDAALRLAGGTAAVFHRETLAFGWCRAEADPRAGIRARFEEISGLVARALHRLGVDARVGAVAGEYCPGDYSVNARGERKLMGVGQRVVRGAAWVGGVIVVGDRERAHRALDPVYAALGIDYDASATGAVEDEIARTTVEAVRDALLAEIGEARELVRADFDAALRAEAERIEPRHLCS